MNTKITVKDVSDVEFSNGMTEAEKVMKSFEKELVKFQKAFEKQPADIRMLVCDALLGNVLNMSKLTAYTHNSILFKYMLLTGLQTIGATPVMQPASNPKATYFG